MPAMNLRDKVAPSTRNGGRGDDFPTIPYEPENGQIAHASVRARSSAWRVIGIVVAALFLLLLVTSLVRR